MIKEFPHITRIITASAYTLISITLVMFMTVLNYYTQIFPENKEYVDLKVNTLKSPLNPTPFTLLGVYFFNHGLEAEAYKTFQIGGDTSTYEQLLNKKQIIVNKEKYWEGLTRDMPNYRDAYIQMGILLYQLGNVSESGKAFNSAITLDPLYSNKKDVIFAD